MSTISSVTAHASDEEALLKEYSDYPESSDSENLGTSSARSKWTLTGLIVLILISLANTALLTTMFRDQRSPHKPHLISQNDTATFLTWKDCGENVKEAQEKGCVFDLMLTSWLHPDCSDPALMEEWLADHDYKFYADKSLTQSLSLEYVRKGTYEEVYTDNYYHFAHCGYAWEMQMRKWRGSRPIDSVLWGYHHTRHCAKSLVNHVQPHNITTLTLGFDSCGTP